MQEQKQTSDDLSSFINLVVNWHTLSIQEIDHIANIPDSEILAVTDQDTGEEEHLTGEKRQAFIKGLLVAKTMLMKLPFMPVEVTEQDEVIAEV